MKVSISWLNEWIEVSDLDPQELAERLTMAGLEVDGVEYPGHGHEDIVVGQILSIEDHPKADRLVVCSVTTGGDEPHQIVCGAKNMKAGDRVPVALPGSEPPGIDFAIGSRKVMGVMSAGMLCSGDELSIESDVDGLMILTEDLPLGEPIFKALGRKDVVLEIDLTPNRPDCLSHLGVAREVAALYGRELRAERLRGPAGPEVGAAASVELDVVDVEGCPQYLMAVLEGVKVGPSPAWLRRRLEAVGQRTINFVVDVTNFLLLDVGQPYHAFDLDKLSGEKILVRRARAGEELLGIDHGTYKLVEEDLVIADGERPVAIAGVMGGAETEVTEETSRILIECAYFNPTTVRKSAKRHGLHTESSHRFERGIDPGALGDNLERILGLLSSVQREVSGVEPTRRPEAPSSGEPPAKTQISMNVERIGRLLGVELSATECQTMLESIGLRLLSAEGEVQTYEIPSFRPDLERPVDLSEEVARLIGYDKIPAKMPSLRVGMPHRRRSGGPSGDDARETIVSAQVARGLSWMRGLLLGAGLSEAINYSFMGADDLDRLLLAEGDRRRDAPRVANPLVKTQALMRTSLVPSLLQNVATNKAHRRQDLALFEIGRRYFVDEERRTLGIALLGRRAAHWSGEAAWDFYDMKGIVESLMTPFEMEGALWVRPEEPEPYLHPGVQAMQVIDGAVVATIGQLHPAVAQKEGVEGALLLAEIDLEVLLSRGARAMFYEEPGKFPAIVRDFALLIDEATPYAVIEEVVATTRAQAPEFGSIFEGLELFDVYQGEQVPEGKRSLAIKVTYRSADRTLTDKDVEAADSVLLKRLEEAGATLR